MRTINIGKILSSVRFLTAMAASALLVVSAPSCMKEDPLHDDAALRVADACSFSLLDEEEGVVTRSVFDNVSGWTDSKKSNVTLAAYCSGTLFAKQYYSSNLTAMTLPLEKGRSYNVYALVNMGDMTASIPDNESGSGGIASLVYTIPSYNSGSNSISQYGIPMAGTLSNLSVTASTSGTQHVPVRRLLARVTLNLSCTWPGALIQSAKVYNLNRRLLPFGSSVAQSSSDILSGFQELTTASSPGSTLTAVMYVPENLQGNLGNATTSGNKRPDGGISAISNKSGVLSYMEVAVTGSAPLSGSVTYRSYLGNNATNNFDIVRNTKYVWNVTYQANGLQTDNWKVDGDLSDNRRIVLRGPFYLERNESLAWSDLVNSGTGQTNIGLGDIAYSFAGLGGQQASAFVTPTSGTMSSGGSFTLKSTAPVGSSATVTATPASNPNNLITGTPISAQAQVNVIDRVVEWKNYDAAVYAAENKKVYPVDPGSSVTAEVDFGYTWNGTRTNERGQRPSKWTFTTPSLGSTSATRITSSYSAGSGNTRDRVTYTVGSQVAYGDYPVTVDRVSPQTGSDQAYIRVNDMRYLRWVDRGTLSGVDLYDYVSESEVHVYVQNGSSLASVGGTNWNLTSCNPNYFHFGNQQGEAYVNGSSSRVTAQTFANYFDITYDQSKFSLDGTNISISATGNGSRVWFNPTVNLPSGVYEFSIAYKDGTHEIKSYLHVTDAISYVLVANPTTMSVNVGSTGTLSANVYRVVNGVRESTPVASGVNATWTSSDNTVATVSGSTVTGVRAGSANMSASYTYTDGNNVNHNLTTTGSDRCAVTVNNVVTYALVANPLTASVSVGGTTTVRADVYRVVNNVRESNPVVTGVSATWSSSSSGVATVNGSGVVTGVSAGTAYISATAAYQGQTLTTTGSDRCTVTVTNNVTHELVITPSNPSANMGQTVSLTATYYTITNGVRDGGTVVTTNSGTTWSRQSGSTGISVSNSGSTKGQVTCTSNASAQSAVIKAAYNGYEATTSVTFNPVVTTDYELSIAPTSSTINVGQTQSYTVTLWTITKTNGVETGRTSSTLGNSSVSWSTSYSSVATVSAGVATGRAAGSTTITARYTPAGYQQISAAATLTVNNNVTYRLSIQPNPGTLNVNRYGTYRVYRQELVNGVYNGNQVQISNTDVTWSVGNMSVATVIGTGTNAGRATGEAPGTTTVTVTLKNSAQYYSDYTSEGLTATATLNVVTSGGIDPGWTDPGSEIVL